MALFKNIFLLCYTYGLALGAIFINSKIIKIDEPYSLGDI